jgi:hypothetical protein
MTPEQAHAAVAKAVAAGELRRPGRCERCNEASNRIVGHHDDYSRPLDVEWLCSSCHQRHHWDERRAGATRQCAPQVATLLDQSTYDWIAAKAASEYRSIASVVRQLLAEAMEREAAA